MVDDRQSLHFSSVSYRWKNIVERTRLYTHTNTLTSSMNTHTTINIQTNGVSQEWSSDVESLNVEGRARSHRLPSILFNDPTERRLEMHDLDSGRRTEETHGRSPHRNMPKVGFADVVRKKMISQSFLKSIRQSNISEETQLSDCRSNSIVVEPDALPQPSNPSHPSNNNSNTSLNGPNDNDSLAGGNELSGTDFVAHIFYGCLHSLKSSIYASFKPNSSFVFYWTFLVVLSLIYNALALSIFIFDDVYFQAYRPWLLMNVIADFIYGLDIAVQCSLIYMKDGIEVNDKRRLVHNYFHLRKFNMTLDFLCLLPIDYFIIFVNPSISLSRATRMLKVLRVIDFVELTEQRLNAKAQNISKLLWLVSCCYIIFHWNACVYFFFSLQQGIEKAEPNDFIFGYTKVFDVYISECSFFMNDHMEDCLYSEPEEESYNKTKYIESMLSHWQSRSHMLAFSNFSKEYAMSIYWSSLTITTCGQQPWPANSAQNMLEVVDTLMGLLVFATILGSVGNVVSDFNEDRTIFQDLLDGTKFYMKYRGVTKGLQDRVTHCIKYTFDNHQMANEKETLSCLPPRLEGRLASHLHMNTLVKAKLFAKCDQGFLYELVLKLRQQLYSPGDLVCQVGERAQAMYIVKTGSLIAFNPQTGSDFATKLGEGSTFGELSIVYVPGLSKETRDTALQAVGYADVYVLTRDDVSLVLQEYPHERKRLMRQARLLHQVELGLDEEDNVADDEQFINHSTMYSFEEKVAKMREILNGISEEMDEVYDDFTRKSSEYKQKISGLEEAFHRNRRRVRRELSLGPYLF